jgi:uncharacterized protein (TIGR02118 family)
MTTEEFWAHYGGPHIAIAKQLPGLRRLVLSRPVGARATEWDAVGELWFDSVEAVDAAFADSEILPLLRADRVLLIGGMEVLLLEEVLDWSPVDA